MHSTRFSETALSQIYHHWKQNDKLCENLRYTVHNCQFSRNMISCIFQLNCKSNAANLKWNSVFIRSIRQESVEYMASIRIVLINILLVFQSFYSIWYMYLQELDSRLSVSACKNSMDDLQLKCNPISLSVSSILILKLFLNNNSISLNLRTRNWWEVSNFI